MLSEAQLSDLAQQIKLWGYALGFQHVGITDPNPDKHATYLASWLHHGYHGTMKYMQTHGEKRQYPEKLIPGTKRIISVRMDYLPSENTLCIPSEQSEMAYIATYALGRDYHKVMRQKLKILTKKIKSYCSKSELRIFVDSGPILEKAFAEKAGLGWIGKNTLLLDREAGSWFFIGEILINIELPIDQATTNNHCGSCTACLDICPTKAFIAPFVLDARKCIAYLTIEYKGIIPKELRQLFGNRVFGCDDCQLVCPWNRFAKKSKEIDFLPRSSINNQKLVTLFSWTKEEYLKNTEGSPLRRIGYEGWLRNIAIGLGNAPTSSDIINALNSKLAHDSALVQEHVFWALEQHRKNSY